MKKEEFQVKNKSLDFYYQEALKDERFLRLVKTLKVSDDIAKKYTSSLEDTVKELNNCSNCKGLFGCKNKVNGCVYYPKLVGDKLIFSYRECKYKTELNNKEKEKLNNQKELELASFKNLDFSDKKRAKVLRWAKSFYDNYDMTKRMKGLYLHGNFGCGKTYIIAALFNELNKIGVKTEIVYFPTLLRELKSDFCEFGSTIDYLLDVDCLLIDDIGAEKVTSWGRDEVLGTILQERMNNYKTTFFTSNLTLEELENHFIINNNSDEEIKSRRIMERIKFLALDMELLSENRRK